MRGRALVRRPFPTYTSLCMNLLLAILVGGLIGWIASKIMGTDPQQGIFMNIVVGIVGALLGGVVANLLGISEGSIVSGDFSLGSLLIALGGAVLLIFLYKAIRGRTRA